MNKTEIFLKRVELDIRSQWNDLVELALSLTTEAPGAIAEHLANSCGVGADSVLRKIAAIHYGATLGHGTEELKQMGQEKVLSQYIKSRRVESYGKTVVMKWSIPGSQRQLVQQQEQRIKAILDIYTSEAFWDFMLSILTDLSEQNVKDLAGESPSAESSAPRP